jgi:hypothetical protein
MEFVNDRCRVSTNRAVDDALAKRGHVFGHNDACRDGFSNWGGGIFRLRHGRKVRLRLLDRNAALGMVIETPSASTRMLTTLLLPIVSPWFLAGI